MNKYLLEDIIKDIETDASLKDLQRISQAIQDKIQMNIQAAHDCIDQGDREETLQELTALVNIIAGQITQSARYLQATKDRKEPKS